MSYRSHALLILPILAATFLFSTTACKKSNGNGSSNTPMSGTIADTAWQASISIGVYSQSSKVFDLIGFSGKTRDTSVLEITFYGPVVLNKSISSDTTWLTVTYFDVQNTYNWGGGNTGGTVVLKVTSYDSVNYKIAGTITGSLYNEMPNNGISAVDSVMLTNGQFNLSYTPEP